MATKAATFADTSFAGGVFQPSTFSPDTRAPSSRQRAQAYRQNPFSKLLALLIAARQRQAEREIARYIATTGGKFTDQVEREITRRLT